MTTRYTDGAVTVTVDDGLATFLRGYLEDVERVTVEACEEEAERIASEARAAWYGPNGVTKETGLSGDIRVVTTLSDTEARISVGSTDRRTAGKRNAPVPVFVHRPSRLSSVYVEVSEDEYRRTPKHLKGPHPDHLSPAAAKKWGNPKGPLVLRANPKAADGKTLLPELVTKPAKAGERALAERISTVVARLTDG